MNAKETIQVLGQDKAAALMAELYGSSKAAENRKRYENLVDQYVKIFGDGDIKLFSSPGRTEIKRKPYRSQSWKSSGRQHQSGLCRRCCKKSFQSDSHCQRNL